MKRIGRGRIGNGIFAIGGAGVLNSSVSVQSASWSEGITQMIGVSFLASCTAVALACGTLAACEVCRKKTLLQDDYACWLKSSEPGSEGAKKGRLAEFKRSAINFVRRNSYELTDMVLSAAISTEVISRFCGVSRPAAAAAIGGLM
ncbi:MAG: hypothetical protein PHE27_08915, partial [Alphaproteobacteria bacterium]|nr:hypothetical protein [Alphaproteobacteria bacterium]